MEDEIAAAQSIYCRPGEFQIVSESSVRLRLSDASWVSVTFPTGYPELSALVHLDGSARPSLQAQLSSEAASLAGSPALLQLLSSAGEASEDPAAEAGPSGAAEEPLEELWLSLAHMHRPKAYADHLGDFARQTNVAVDLFAAPGLIRIRLEGRRSAVRRWLVLLRSVCVDVDTAGRPCRERLSRELTRRTLEKAQRDPGQPLFRHHQLKGKAEAVDVIAQLGFDPDCAAL